MKIILALCFALGLSSMASAQCENGVCLLPKVAETVQNVATVPFRLVAAVAAPMSVASEDCGCHGQCGLPDCTCAPAAVVAVEEYQTVARRTPVRTILRSPFSARPLQRLFRCR